MKLWKMLLFVAAFGTTVLFSCNNAETTETDEETITEITDDTTSVGTVDTTTAPQDTTSADTTVH